MKQDKDGTFALFVEVNLTLVRVCKAALHAPYPSCRTLRRTRMPHSILISSNYIGLDGGLGPFNLTSKSEVIKDGTNYAHLHD